MNRIKFYLIAVLSLLMVGISPASGPAPAAFLQRHYPGDFSTALRIGADIQRMLAPKYRPQFPSNPVFKDLEVMPAARPAVTLSDAGKQPVQGVMLTAGFIDFANKVAHARAIDRIEPGFFDRYVRQLSQESGAEELSAVPNFSNAAYWAEEVRNEQLSDFNQITGMVLAINLAHVYLGQYEKYANRLTDPDGKPVPLARLLSNHEWLKAMRTATRNSLETGLGMSGYIAMCEAIDQMPTRPAWTEYFMPRGIKATKVKGELRILEAAFFSGRSLPEDK